MARETGETRRGGGGLAGLRYCWREGDAEEGLTLSVMLSCVGSRASPGQRFAGGGDENPLLLFLGSALVFPWHQKSSGLGSRWQHRL